MDLANDEFINFLTCASMHKLSYLCIGGQAVNYYGYHRSTNDLDVWIAPNNHNKVAFIKTLHCMGYSESETSDIEKEDFSSYFMCSLGHPPSTIDVLTIVHKEISFEDAEKNMEVMKINDTVEMRFIPYHGLLDIKTRSSRFKDWDDVAKLKELNKDKNL